MMLPLFCHGIRQPGEVVVVHYDAEEPRGGDHLIDSKRCLDLLHAV
jgi:hypothetical protein